MNFKLQLVVVAATLASCVSGAALDIFSPPIIQPDAATVWKAGTFHNVTWDASNPPPTISNGALIQLRTQNSAIFPPVTLASGFSLLTGHQLIQVPANATTRHDYLIVLFGDSGNTSPLFTIVH